MDFAAYLNANSHRFDEYLASFFTEVDDADMRRYLYDPLAAYTANAGKRHRPLICTLACQAVGGSGDEARSSAAAIEHFHNAALIHDDIADESLTRRGEPCMHIGEGLGLAINAGDLALTLVIATPLRDENLSAERKLRVITELVRMNEQTIDGQALDIGWARDGRFDLTVEDYLKMATYKTAFYSGAVPLAIGAICGGGTEEEIEALRAFGLATGLAFQIQDDLLNLIGTAEATKKDFRSDIVEGKRTYMAIHALNCSSDAAELQEILVSHTDEPARLARAVQIMEEAGSIAEARAYAETLTRTAQTDLDAMLSDSPAKQLLLSMATFFIDRLS
jgi:geranylgeranyl diphosphate synthase, type I